MPHNLCKRFTSPDPCKAWYYLPPYPSPHPPTLTLTPHDCQSPFQLVAGGGIRVRGMGCPAPTPQAGRVTNSDGGGCERSSATQFVQKHRGGNSNVADVTRIHSAPSPKALNFTARLLLRRVISLRAVSYGAQFHSAHSPTAPNFFKHLLVWRLICKGAAGQNLASSPCALNFAARPLPRR